jgi:serine/threonine protein kinase
MNYKQKYLKYKNKYLKIKQYGSSYITNQIKNEIINNSTTLNILDESLTTALCNFINKNCEYESNRLGSGANGNNCKLGDTMYGIKYSQHSNDNTFKNFEIPILEYIHESTIKSKNNILKIIKKNISVEPYFFIYEYKKGYTDIKSQLLVLQENDIIQIYNQLVNVITELHTIYVVHSDIKPENILYSMTEKEIILIDFGLSENYYKKLELHDNLICTIIYEDRYRYKYDYKHIKSTILKQQNKYIYYILYDYWSVGITLYEIFFTNKASEYLYHPFLYNTKSRQSYKEWKSTPIMINKLYTCIYYKIMTELRSKTIFDITKWGCYSHLFYNQCKKIYDTTNQKIKYEVDIKIKNIKTISQFMNNNNIILPKILTDFGYTGEYYFWNFFATYEN